MDQDMQNKIDAIFADVNRSDSPGCAMGIVQDGELIYTQGYGMANLECEMPIDSASIFHVASVSKQFTCMAILLLLQDGKLKLDDDVRRYIPELPDYGDVITIRHLAHHISGLRDQWELLRYAGWREDDVKTNDDVLYLAARQRGVNFRPGEEYLYCNTGYTLMAIIVERLSGQLFRAFTTERIFKPSGMARTHFHDFHGELVVGRTSAYQKRQEGGYQVSIPMFDTVGATSLFTTVEDLARWAHNFETGVVGSDVLDVMHKQGVLNSGEQIGYALGQSVETYRGLKQVQHSGSDAGYRSHFVRFPEQNAAMIVLSNLNTSNPGGRVRQMMDVYFEGILEPLPKKASEEETVSAKEKVEVDVICADYLGDYYCYDVDATYRVFDDDGLQVYRPKRGTGNLKCNEADVFNHGSETWRFQRSGDGCVCGVSISSGRVRNLWFARQS